MEVDEQDLVFDLKFGSGGRIDYYIAAGIAISRRCIGYVYHRTHWDVGIHQQDARYASFSRALVVPAESSVKGRFVDVGLRCWLVMASQPESCVCAMERGSPNPGSAGVDEASFLDSQSAVVHKYFPLPIDLRNLEAHEIAGGIVQQGRLVFAHGSSRAQTRAFIMHVYVKYHPGKDPRNLVVAAEVGIYLHRLFEFYKCL